MQLMINNDDVRSQRVQAPYTEDLTAPSAAVDTMTQLCV